MVQGKAKYQPIGTTTRRIARLRRRPFSGAAPLGVRPHNSTYAQAGTESVPARVSFTQKVPQGRNIPDLNSEVQENDHLSEQCLESNRTFLRNDAQSAKTSLVSSTSCELEDARAPPPPVSTRNSARDVTTIKSLISTSSKT